ncbi:hypothetical protein P7C73_g1896, partial [Tremellales sp. Uapishka_1]
MSNITHVDIGHLKKGEVNLGTSIMAVQFDGGVVIGADSRTTTGSYIVSVLLSYTSIYPADPGMSSLQANRVTDKLTHIHDRIYCCRSGSAADTQAVADIVHQHAQVYTALYGTPPPVATVTALFQKLCYENKDQLSAGIIVAGWDEEQGGSVYNIPLGGGQFRQPWAIGGSGSTYVYGYCDATYQDGWNEAQTVEFVKNTLSLAMARDGSSGGCIRIGKPISFTFLRLPEPNQAWLGSCGHPLGDREFGETPALLPPALPTPKLESWLGPPARSS